MRITAKSVSGSVPTRCASGRRPSASVTSIRSAPCTTWLLVRIKPSGVMMKPDPLPPSCPRCPPFLRTSIFTTDGLTCSAALVTALENASSSCDASSLGGGGDAPVAGLVDANCLLSQNDAPGAAHSPCGDGASLLPGSTSISFSAILITTTGLAVATPVSEKGNLSNRVEKERDCQENFLRTLIPESQLRLAGAFEIAKGLVVVCRAPPVFMTRRFQETFGSKCGYGFSHHQTSLLCQSPPK